MLSLKFIFYYLIFSVYAITLMIAGGESTFLYLTERYKKEPNNICDENNTISVMTYNVWGLPIALSGHDQEQRFLQLPSATLQTDHEIICLQEVFHKALQNRYLLENKDYYTGTDYSCSSSQLFGLFRKDCYGGLMTFSKYPIINEEFHKFRTAHRNIIESLGDKGFLVTKIMREEREILVVNTHLFSGCNDFAARVRYDQVSEIIKHIKKIQTKGQKVILAGDFNFCHSTDQLAYRLLLKQLNIIDTGAIAEQEEFTYDKTFNKYIPKHERTARLDFIFVQSKPSHILKERLIFNKDTQLSDHFGWRVDVILN